MVTCPECGLLSPDTAVRCDCGFLLQFSGQRRSVANKAHGILRSLLTSLLISTVLVAIGLGCGAMGMWGWPPGLLILSPGIMIASPFYGVMAGPFSGPVHGTQLSRDLTVGLLSIAFYTVVLTIWLEIRAKR